MPGHAATLQQIAQTQAAAFYHGVLADQIDLESRKYQGFLRKSDLEAYDVQWVTPLSIDYHGYSILELPPNGQGLVTLLALNTLRHFEPMAWNQQEMVHRQWEAIKMAFADGQAAITDPQEMRVSLKTLLSEDFGRRRAAEIGAKAQLAKPMELGKSGTVYLCTADQQGNMVSYIQSNYMGFGSGIVVKETGIALQNRGADFSLDPHHVNALKPGKKTYHTIIPGFLMKGQRALGPFGVMGGTMQPQGHLQVVMNLIDFHFNPQMALDAPRWQFVSGKKFLVEPHFDRNLARLLKECGHEVEIALEPGGFGRGQIILRMENGTYWGGCDSRTDSNIACY